MTTKFIGYYRVSTTAQGISGLGLDAQKEAVTRYVTQTGGVLCAEFVEIESGRKADRPKLRDAIEASKKLKARLVVAKFDRLARNALLLLRLRDSGVDFLAADMPNANKLTVGLLAVIAENERDLVSQRTREALEQAKKRGVRLGNPRLEEARPEAAQANRRKAEDYALNLLPVVREIRKAGIKSLRGIAKVLNVRGFVSPRGGPLSAKMVSNILRREKKPEPSLFGAP